MKRNWVIIVVTTFVMLAVALLVVHLHSLSKRAVLSRFQEHELLHAHHFAEQIESFFWGHSRGLQALPLFFSSQTDRLDRMKAYIGSYSPEMEKDYIRGISLCDEVGRVVYSTDVNAVGSSCGESKVFTWAKKKGKKGEMLVSPLPMGGNSLLFHLSIPLYQGDTDPSHSQKGEKFAGVISLKLDLKEFLTNELKKEKVALQQVWIIDKDGTLLFHSEHPEMTLRNIHQEEKRCNACHISFDYIGNILKEREGATDYQLRNSPKKLAAFSTADFGNSSWSIVVNVPYDEAVAFATKSLQGHLTLLGLVVLAFMMASTLIIRNHQFKVKAEAEAEHLMERIEERKKAEEELRESERQRRRLSFELLMAQETERRRISRELHDELGGALAVFKLRVSHIEKNLSQEQIELKEDCRSNLKYIDQVIEDVHRLSRDLSPSILEDLGLSAALQWLIGNFEKNYHIKMMPDVIDIDHLFPRNTQIVVYRIVQETLTNIGKHSQAEVVSLVVKRDGNVISLSIEDDGKGFDVKKEMMKDAGEKGLGLAFMEERARMLGGSLDVWSEEGQGTRITLHIPMGRKEIS